MVWILPDIPFKNRGVSLCQFLDIFVFIACRQKIQGRFDNYPLLIAVADDKTANQYRSGFKRKCRRSLWCRCRPTEETAASACSGHSAMRPDPGLAREVAGEEAENLDEELKRRPLNAASW